MHASIRREEQKIERKKEKKREKRIPGIVRHSATLQSQLSYAVWLRVNPSTDS